MKVDFIAGALRYVALGWKVLLLAPGSKLPFVSKQSGGSGVHDATSDPDQIRLLSKICPHGNIGIACGNASGIVAVDIDPRNGGDQSIRAIAAKGYSFPTGPRQRTGNGGFHLLYRHEASISNSQNKLGPGIDIKSTGGYIVGAPSWTGPSTGGSGGSYVWEVSPFDVPPPPLPMWMATALRPRPRRTQPGPETRGGEFEALAHFVATSSPGERNNRLHWAACRAAEMVLAGRISTDYAGGRLVAAATTAGLDEREVVRTIGSALRKAGQRFGK